MSKHYNEDERFVPLLEKIANQLVNRVRQTIEINTIFKSKSFQEAKLICSGAKHLLIKWKTEYQRVRSTLENDKRIYSNWNFDHHILFDRTDYCSDICDDLIEISQNFYRLTRLKNVFDDEITVKHFNGEISQVLQRCFQCDFDPFERDSMEKWRSFVDELKRSFTTIDDEMKSSIEFSFSRFRSVETALENFQRNEILFEELQRPSSSILVQYCQELDEIQEVFQRNKGEPTPIKVGSIEIFFSFRRWSNN